MLASALQSLVFVCVRGEMEGILVCHRFAEVGS